LKLTAVLFIIGILMLISGVVLAIAAPAGVTWQPKSEVLASEKPLTVSAGWNSKSQILINKLMTVDMFGTYNSWLASAPIIVEEAMNIVALGTATEQSSPQRTFNFYVFNSVNFDLWKAGLVYTAYYKTVGKTSVDFSFSLATKDSVPSMFYFVVEEYASGVKPAVWVTAIIRWTEKASMLDCSEYYANYWTIIIEESKDFTLEGNASEASGKKFNFLILDSTNYWNLMGDKAYTPYFEKTETTSTTFSIPLTKDEATSTIYFVAENPLSDTSETVKFSATLKWNEKATIAATIGGWILGGAIAILGVIVIIIAGIATLVFKPKAPAPTPPTPPRPPPT